MSATHEVGHHKAHHGPVATLVRSVPVRLVEVSQGGCRLESAHRIQPGTAGQLAVQIQTLTRIDDVRVARCLQRAGAGPLYHVGAELLPTRHLSRRTVRMAVRRIISGGPSQGSVRAEVEGSPPAETSTSEPDGELSGRAPAAGRS